MVLILSGAQGSKHQATSIKPQAASIKLQATSIKLQDPRATVKFHGALIEGLDHDKRVVWMFDMEADLMG